MKRKPIAKKSKASISKAKNEAWKWCSRFVRLRGEIIGTGKAACVTCGNHYPIRGVGAIHAGHFIPGRRNAILYDTRGINPQCQICNRWRKGCWVEYEAWMLRTHGAEVVAHLKALSMTTVSMTTDQHLEKAREFQALVESLGGWKE